MSRRGMALARSMVCATFSSRVSRETRSSTLFSIGSDGSRNGMAAAPGSKVICSIRPQALDIADSFEGPNRIAAEVEQVTFLGELSQVR